MNSAESIKGVISQAVQNAGYVLADVKITFEHGRQNLTIYIDTTSRPVSMGDCITISKLINPMIEQAGIMNGAYFLNVSSPTRPKNEHKL